MRIDRGPACRRHETIAKLLAGRGPERARCVVYGVHTGQNDRVMGYEPCHDQEERSLSAARPGSDASQFPTQGPASKAGIVAIRRTTAMTEAE